VAAAPWLAGIPGITHAGAAAATAAAAAAARGAAGLRGEIGDGSVSVSADADLGSLAAMECTDTMHAATAIMSLSQVPDPRAMLGTAAWRMPGPIVPSAAEEAFIRTFFERPNRLLCAVDEDYFYAALEEAQHFVPDEHAGDDGGGGSSGGGGGGGGECGDGSGGGCGEAESGAMSLLPTAVTAEPVHPFKVVRQRSDAFGFRVCYYTLLCMGAKLQGRYKLAKRYYELARAYIGPCFAQPSQHLVSALLLMTMITRSLCADPKQSSLHAALAWRMVHMVDNVSPTVAMMARMMNASHQVPRRTEWPAAAMVADETPHARYADILGFVMAGLVEEFRDVKPEQHGRLRSLLEEALELQVAHNLMPGLPLRAYALAVSALLYLQVGDKVTAFEQARHAVELALPDRLARFCFPVVVAIVKLLPLLREMSDADEAAEAAAAAAAGGPGAGTAAPSPPVVGGRATSTSTIGSSASTSLASPTASTPALSRAASSFVEESRPNFVPVPGMVSGDCSSGSASTTCSAPMAYRHKDMLALLSSALLHDMPPIPPATSPPSTATLPSSATSAAFSSSSSSSSSASTTSAAAAAAAAAAASISFSANTATFAMASAAPPSKSSSSGAARGRLAPRMAAAATMMAEAVRMSAAIAPPRALSPTGSVGSAAGGTLLPFLDIPTTPTGLSFLNGIASPVAGGGDVPTSDDPLPDAASPVAAYPFIPAAAFSDAVVRDLAPLAYGESLAAAFDSGRGGGTGGGRPGLVHPTPTPAGGAGAGAGGMSTLPLPPGVAALRSVSMASATLPAAAAAAPTGWSGGRRGAANNNNNDDDDGASISSLGVPMAFGILDAALGDL